MSKRRISISKLFKTATLITGVCLFLWSVKISYEKQKVRASLDIQKQLDFLVSSIKDELNGSTEVLYALSNLLSTIKDLGPEEFEKFTSDLSIRKKGILMVEWQPRVRESEREAFVRKVRGMGVTSFKMVEPNSQNKLIRAKNRPEHFPVLYAVSTRNQEISIGLDLSWSPVRMRSKYLARDLGELRASNTFEVMLTGGEQTLLPGFAISLPVYNTVKVPKTMQGRRRELRGFLASVIYLDDLLGPLIKKLESSQLNVRIVDLGTGDEISEAKGSGINGFEKRSKLNVFGQKWGVTVIPTNDFLRGYFSPAHFAVPLFLLLFILTLIWTLRRNEKINAELRKTRGDLEKALEDARVAANSKMLFLANMSHEMRTPMNAILGYAGLMKEEPDEKLRHQYLDRMTSCGDQLLNVIDDVLEISSLEESRVKLDPHKFDIHELVAQINDTFISKNVSSEIEYTSSVDSSLGILYGDSNRLRQVLLNLLGNALKFTEKGRVSLSCTHRGMDEAGNTLVEFKVEDTGVGMEDSYLSTVYHPFSQEDPTFSRKKGGVGLGLSIIHGLVELMGGKIEVKTEKGVGTTFATVLPFNKVLSDPGKTDECCELNFPVKEFDQRKVILVAEDDEDSRFLIDNFLRGQNFELDFVSNGKEMLEHSSNKAYDMIVTDIQMPELDGLSATKELRSKGVRIPILALSAHALPEEKEKAKGAGIDEVLSKPFNKVDLVSFISKYLGSQN